VFESLTAWLSSNFFEHVVTTQRFRDAFGLVLSQRVVWFGARDFENTIVEHYNSQRAECNTRTDLDFIHVVNAETARLFNPIFEKWIAQSVFGFRLGKIRAFDNETIFAHFFGLLSRSIFWTERRRQVSGSAVTLP